MGQNTKIILAIILLFFAVTALISKCVSNKVLDEFKKLDEKYSNLTFPKTDDEKLEYLFDSIVNCNGTNKNEINNYQNNFTEINFLINTLTSEINLKMKSQEDLDIAEEIMTNNHLSDSLYLKLKKHLLLSEKLNSNDSIKSFLKGQWEYNILDKGKKEWINANFHETPAIGGVTILDAWHYRIRDITLSVLESNDFCHEKH